MVCLHWPLMSATAWQHGKSEIEVSSARAGCLLCGGSLVRRYTIGAHSVDYCSACQLGQLAPLPSADELAALYGSSEYFQGTDQVGYADYSTDAPQFARTFQAKLKQLMRHGTVGDLLEIGCGPGYFLREARRAGVPEVVGVDRNPWAVQEAHRSGLEAYVGSIEVMPPNRVFDAVAMLDLIEHITEPVSFLKDVRKHLRPGGRVFIMTPNIRSVLAFVSGRRWVSFKIPEHVLWYSPRSMRMLLERCGFEVVECRGTGQFVTIAFLLDRLRRIAPLIATGLEVIVRSLKAHEQVVFVTNGSIDVVARRTADPR
jgi:SAM-dependent methyltransferase